MDIKHLESVFENCLNELFVAYKTKGSDYFFTEKEIHSYFYYLCQSNNSFEVINTNLIHTEYPTPFKCQQIDNTPYIKKIGDADEGKRAHLDLVLINPNFVEWVLNTNTNQEIIYGLGGINFKDYMPGFRAKYDIFMNQYSEPILLYAIEFKFFRHVYDGIKYSIKSILQDIEKLKLLQYYNVGSSKISFVKNTQSFVFIGKRCTRLVSEIDNTPAIDRNICKILFQ